MLGTGDVAPEAIVVVQVPVTVSHFLAVSAVLYEVPPVRMSIEQVFAAATASC